MSPRIRHIDTSHSLLAVYLACRRQYEVARPRATSPLLLQNAFAGLPQTLSITVVPRYERKTLAKAKPNIEMLARS